MDKDEQVAALIRRYVNDEIDAITYYTERRRLDPTWLPDTPAVKIARLQKALDVGAVTLDEFDERARIISVLINLDDGTLIEEMLRRGYEVPQKYLKEDNNG